MSTVENTKAVQVTRLCGHEEVVVIPDCGRDEIYMRRRAKTRCSACAEPYSNGSLSNSHKIRKGQESKFLPPGTVLTLEKTAERRWKGKATAGTSTVEHGPAGLMGVCSSLCRKLLIAGGMKVQGNTNK